MLRWRGCRPFVSRWRSVGQGQLLSSVLVSGFPPAAPQHCTAEISSSSSTRDHPFCDTRRLCWAKPSTNAMVPAPKSWQQSGLAAKSRGFALLRSLRLARLVPFLTRSRGKEEVVGTAWPSQLIGGHKKELLWVHYNVQMKSTLWEPLENVDLGSQPLYASFHGGRRQLQIIPLSQRHCPPSYPCSQNQHQLTELAVEVPLDLLGSPHISNFQEALGRRGVSECPGARKMPPSAQGGKGIESPARVPGYLVPFDGEAPGSGEVGNGAPALSRPPWFHQMPQ